MNESLQNQQPYFEGYVQAVQYLTGITVHQELWTEVVSLMVKFFSADFAAISERQNEGGQIVIGCSRPENHPLDAWSHGAGVKGMVAEVFESGFFATADIRGDENLKVLLLPITSENRTTAVLVIVYRSEGDLSRAYLNTCLAIAGIIGTTHSRLSSETELRRHRNMLEDIVIKRTSELGETILKLKQEILQRTNAEAALQLMNEELEIRVADRTEKLKTSMESLQEEIYRRKRTEEQIKATLMELERSNKELEQFAYVASHDLQEPLRMVSSYTQLLAQRYENQLDDKAQKFMGYAVDGAVRMQRLINDLLAYSRVSTQGKTLGTIDSHAALGEALRNLATAIEETRAIVINDDLPTIRADATQLSQLFQNLIGNAIKFRGADLPRISISACDLGREWRFSVQDNGIGIETQYAEKVFAIFQRLHTRAEYPGTGIGLAICKRIVERHGGRIWFESEPGFGSTFFFTMPKRKETA